MQPVNQTLISQVQAQKNTVMQLWCENSDYSVENAEKENRKSIYVASPSSKADLFLHEKDERQLSVEKAIGELQERSKTAKTMTVEGVNYLLVGYTWGSPEEMTRAGFERSSDADRRIIEFRFDSDRWIMERKREKRKPNTRATVIKTIQNLLENLTEADVFPFITNPQSQANPQDQSAPLQTSKMTGIIDRYSRSLSNKKNAL